MALETLKPQVSKILESSELSVEHRLEEVCSLLKDNIAYYDWVGFYFSDSINKPNGVCKKFLYFSGRYFISNCFIVKAYERL